ncbi:MAG: hypothetical protein A3B68_02000 [Candidatus Melainabacteria bacterium RIFCSPHIGHO2_02_FULL_34_12]|nr:MAG: hypothetical protein A3B68_02000 [Candidatus Melainabacteria bacterium RIFCSPHIGHO2_02_FULL_34_12]
MKTVMEQNTVNKKDEIKNILSESKDMVGEKDVSEGVFHKIFRGYIPLNLLSGLKLDLEGPQKEKIDAYCNLINIALRKNTSILNYLLKGYGTNIQDVNYKKTALDEYETEKSKLDDYEKEVIKALGNPDNSLKEWFSELKINPDLLKSAVVNPFQIDQDAYIPPEVLDRMSKIGLFSLKVPKKYGGLGFSQKEYDMVLRTLAHISGTLLAVVSAHSTIGSAPLLMYGSEEQKERYLKLVSEGNFLVAFGLTEPASGTDAVGKMQCIAKLSPDGKNWIVNGEKIYITNIHRSGLMYMMAKTDLEKGLSVERMKPTVFIVELPFRITDSIDDINKKRKELEQKGMRMSAPLDLMMIRGSNQSHITFENFQIPVNDVLGGVEGGSKVIFNGLNKGRAGFGASSAEAARYIFEGALHHAVNREMFKAFGGKQSDLPQVKKYISRMAVNACALRSISDMTTALIQEHGDKINIIAECAAIKILATEGSWDVATHAMRLWGGTGTMRGHTGGMELAFRDAWIGIIVEGVNEAMKQLVTGVGVQGVKDDADTIGRHLFSLIKPFISFGKPKKDEDQKKKKKFTFDLFGSLIPAKLRLIAGMLRFEKGSLNFSDAFWLQWHTKILSLKTAQLGLKYGNNMVVQQLELIRMSDIAMDLYSLSAVQIKLKSNSGDLELAESSALKRFISITKKRIKENLNDLKIGNKDDKEDLKVADLWIKNKT